ncbi:NAD-glutamate dehydrogenase [Chitinimonas prasina]|uniref:NAD-glutamate dehydrogenase n=1 Tax=Chitinimonas prasina TaxID=1434937 RepID=A0ABQ5YHK4_9NEIS|nr:NAD-glutamate dehydrogenase [Chitinimonas prasina]GLR13137.1 NAD-glutamate dehydrogenase [Chitinimonas prasina]
MQTFHASLLADIQRHADAREAGPVNLTSLIQNYYADTDAHDLARRDAQDWYGAVLAHLKLAATRKAGEAQVRVYNPSFDDHRWQTSHTVIELVNDDKPFLVDTVSLALNRLGYGIHLIIHPVLKVTRNKAGKLDELGAGQAESWIHLEIDRISDKSKLDEIKAELLKVLSQLKDCVEDFDCMAKRLAEVHSELTKCKPAVEKAEWQEALSYLEWLQDDHFVFLGYRDYNLTDSKEGVQLTIVKGSGLGLLRGETRGAHSASFAALPADIRALARDKTPLLLTKTNSRSTVHRGAYLDCVGLKRYDSKGNVTGERRFLGLYTAKAYNTPPHQIPVLRRKIDAVMAASQVAASSHKGKTLLNVLETYPRDELLEISESALSEISLGIVSLQERNQVRAFIREDLYRRYVSALVYLPRDNYNTDVRVKMQQLLLNAFNGTSAEFNVMLSDSVLARIQFIVRTPTGSSLPDYDPREIEANIAQATRRWTDDLQLNLASHAGEERGMALHAKYARAFAAAYYADYDARTAVSDIDKIEQALAGKSLTMKLMDASLADPTLHRFKIFREDPIALSDSLPVLENMGVRVIEEQPYTLKFADGGRAWVTDIAIKLPISGLLDEDETRNAFQQGFAAIFEGHAENDRFNKLILLAGLGWREVVLLRAYAKYLKQIGLNYSLDHIAERLGHFREIARDLATLFLSLHDPKQKQVKQVAALSAKIKEALAQVPSIDDERILSGFFHTISATLRTNFFQPGPAGEVKDYISFKFESAKIPNMPQPVPLYEIFVYSPRVEGIHLRFGKVARGGLRWSDRKEDFRTEVLGLVKAQQVKNTVIVPVGSKGGFVLKQAPTEREAYQAEGVACYKTFIRGLLDLTDNLVDGKVVPPKAVHRLDADDPYLVVAADKGTATFSDIANGVSQEYGFWLDDAFASGGSVGYDHKKMGITAKGAWESVKRHFREMGHDTQKQPFTVVGIGDLMGDVFGNGMLLSDQIKLVAAFNHLHIFLDPNPDTAKSFKERSRMFALPRSSWEDYDKKTLSKGGGIYSRSAKSIPLSPEIRKVLDITDEALAPNDLIRAILKAPVDLLYNGGIGTYFKSSSQSHAEASDRSNDALRIDGREIRARVIGEGGNLGFTQLGRVEYALSGGHICTDAIDNSAGVDCSDHEVNIKILLGRLVQAGDMTLKQRNALLAEMTDNVGELVLRDNYLQTAAISLELKQAKSLLSVHGRFMQSLERAGRLSRRIEYLPNDALLAERQAAGQGMTSPELAVLLAYAKLGLFDQLLASPLPAMKEWDELLSGYFPTKMADKFKKQLPSHPLRSEIVATVLTNECVNRMGISFVFRVAEETNATPAEIVHAWSVASRLMQADKLWAELEALDNTVPTTTQYDLMLEVRKQLERVARWVLRVQLTEADADKRLVQLTDEIPTLLPKLDKWVADKANFASARERLKAAGVKAELAGRVVYLDAVLALLDIARLARESKASVEDVAQAYFKLEGALQIDWLREVVDGLPRDNRWQTLARMALRDELYREHAGLTARVLAGTGTVQKRVDAWLKAREVALEHVGRMFEELRVATPDLAMLSAAMREIRNRLAA